MVNENLNGYKFTLYPSTRITVVLFVAAFLFPSTPAMGSPVHVDAMDVAGESFVDDEKSVTKNADGSPVREITSLTVFPKKIHLSTGRAYQTVIAQIQYKDGLTQDITDKMKWSLENPELCQWNSGRLEPVANGNTTLIGTYEGRTVKVPVEIQLVETTDPISFRGDVMPVFLKTGCNSGSCHGAARGKDGFRLSIFGFDPLGDHYRLTKEMPGRRLDMAFPDQSLLMEKGLGIVSHTGGALFKKNDPNYKTLLHWIEAGAKNDPGKVPTVDAVELFPKRAVLNGKGAQQKLVVLATYSNGRKRDVTSLAIFSSSDDNAAKVSKAGVVTAGNRGESFIMARFDTHTVGTPFIVLPKDLKFHWESPPENNYVDRLMNQKWRRLRINPSKICDDRTFIRRVTLDICGMLPTSEELGVFESDKSPKKRSALVDSLLKRKEFVDLWVMKWAELLQIRSTPTVSYKSALLYFNWLGQQIAGNVPIDQMVRDILKSQGGTFTSPATNYYQNETDTLKVAENVAQVFLGMRIQCAQCHNHPFDRWTMDDYYSFSAFFSQVGRKRGQDPRETIVFNRGSGDVRHMVGNRVMTPKFLGGIEPKIAKGQDRRKVLASWLASKENPFFAKNLSNIVWAHFFGQGIINQVDDVRVSNPAVNQGLLDEMAKRFAESNFDFKQLVRDICTSRTYQLSTAANESNATDETNFSRKYLTRVRSEVLLDIISQVTDTGNKFQGLAFGATAVQIADGNTSNYFLRTFGRAKRETVCSCEVIVEPNLSQALHLLNGDTVNQKCRNGGLVIRMLKEKKTSKDVVVEIYRRCLSRRPTEKEINALVAAAGEKKQLRAGLEDVFWAVLNSQEFLFNH